MLGISASAPVCHHTSLSSVQISFKMPCNNPLHSCQCLSNSWYISHIPQAFTVGSTLSSNMKATIAGFECFGGACSLAGGREMDKEVKEAKVCLLMSGQVLWALHVLHQVYVNTFVKMKKEQQPREARKQRSQQDALQSPNSVSLYGQLVLMTGCSLLTLPVNNFWNDNCR